MSDRLQFVEVVFKQVPAYPQPMRGTQNDKLKFVGHVRLPSVPSPE